MYSKIYASVYICTMLNLYIIMVCTEHATIAKSGCALLTAIGMVYIWLIV